MTQHLVIESKMIDFLLEFVMLQKFFVLESSSTADPQFPILQLTNLNSNILNAVVGENIVGKTSGASLVFVATNGSNENSFVSQNENSFEIGEEVIFEETQVSGVVQTFIPGDRDIKNNYEFDPGSKIRLC